MTPESSTGIWEALIVLAVGASAIVVLAAAVERLLRAPRWQRTLWQATLLGYLTSTFYCMKAELKQMLSQGGGAIVNNSSVDGKRAFTMAPAYSAAKHGVLGLTKSTALQYAAQGIRINAVCPGWIRTPPVERMMARDPDNETMMLDHQPIGRLGEAGEVAAAVAWLCSDKASFITGIALDVDGGYLAL